MRILKNLPAPKLMAACLLAVLGGCATPPAQQTTVKAPEPNPARYAEAIKDASNPEPGEIINTLTAIRQDNPKLIWKTEKKQPYVQMASVTDSVQYYIGTEGKPYNTSAYFMWVSAVPEVKDVCSSPGFGSDPIPRLRQLLGLTPDAKISHVVTLWVRPESLFRPAPDNEVTDTTAGLNLPDNTEGWYRQWFNELRAKQYFQSENPKHNAYPWTQLGYTYDWGNGNSEVGISEFVIKTHSDVVIDKIIPIGEYCGK